MRAIRQRPLALALGALLLAAALAGGAYWLLRGDASGGAPARPPPAVVLAPAGTADIVRAVESVGDTRATEAVTLTAKVAGRIERINFTDGGRVRRDEVLVQLEQTELRADLAALEAEAAEIEGRFGRQEELLARGSTARATVDDSRRQLQAARARVAAAYQRLDDASIRAPFDGRMGLRDISVGTLVEPGAAVATLDAVSPIDLRFSVPERYLADVRVGAAVEARTPAYPERPFEGRVRAIDSRVDPALRTVTVEARLANPGGELLPGMLMNVRLATGTTEGAVVVPPLAVVVRGDRHFVYRVADGAARRVEIEIGQREADRVEVTKGLEPGEPIVVEGVQELSEGQAVRVAEATPGPGPGPRPDPESDGDGEGGAGAPGLASRAEAAEPAAGGPEGRGPEGGGAGGGAGR